MASQSNPLALQNQVDADPRHAEREGNIALLEQSGEAVWPILPARGEQDDPLAHGRKLLRHLLEQSAKRVIRAARPAQDQDPASHACLIRNSGPSKASGVPRSIKCTAEMVQAAAALVLPWSARTR
jgi:hypothetical protein